MSRRPTPFPQYVTNSSGRFTSTKSRTTLSDCQFIHSPSALADTQEVECEQESPSPKVHMVSLDSGLSRDDMAGQVDKTGQYILLPLFASIDRNRYFSSLSLHQCTLLFSVEILDTPETEDIRQEARKNHIWNNSEEEENKNQQQKRRARQGGAQRLPDWPVKQSHKE